MSIIFDIETDGLLLELTKIHSLVIYDIDSKQLISCTDNSPEYLPIKEGIKILEKADTVIGHNIVKFDLAAIEKLYPDFKPRGEIIDTLIYAKLKYPDIAEKDYKLVRQNKLPAKLTGRYSLESFGYRLGFLKGDYCKQENAWAYWSEAMQSYCEQDVKVTCKLYEKLVKENPVKPEVLQLEQEFAKIIGKQEQRGVLFNKAKAIELTAQLLKQKTECETKLKEAFPPEIQEEEFIPKVNNKKRGYIKGQPFIKKKVIEFNPASRQMIGERLIKKYGWKPVIYTDTGIPKIDEKVLKELNYPETSLLLDYLTLSKILGMLTEGNNAWLKHIGADNIIHGGVDTLGAVTGRCTHKNPNLAQTPAVEKDKNDNILYGLKGGYGFECRELFIARNGFKIVGCDASGLELRNLAHYINSPSYTEEILTGDIHAKNQHLAGIETRAAAKKFIYAFNYGAGDEKLGKLIGGSSLDITKCDKSEVCKIKKKLKKHGLKATDTLICETIKGQEARQRFLNALPELKTLIQRVKAVIKKRGFLYGIDRRILKIREQYKGLNTLLQSAGAVVMKKALCILYSKCIQKGWIKDGYYIKPDDSVYFILNIHDEYQAEVKPEIIDEYKFLAVNSIKEAGKYFNYRCPLDGEAKVGVNWAETH